jgi:uncharacterized DUF497 family protein
MDRSRTIHFTIAGLTFEYDEQKEQMNIRKHGVSFRTAARVFFDEDYIEEYDSAHSDDEPRYNVIGDVSAGNARLHAAIGNVDRFAAELNDILYVVYTERISNEMNTDPCEIIRIISARLANSFERGLYYGQYL